MEEEYSVRNLTPIDIQDDGCALKNASPASKEWNCHVTFIVADKDLAKLIWRQCWVSGIHSSNFNVYEIHS